MTGKKHNKTGRSKGEARHVRLYHWLLNSAAWQSLGPVPKALYVEMAARYNGTNNGRIHYSVREGADSLHVGRSTIARALETLQKRGFIVVAKRGGFSLKVHHATEWRLTEFQCDVMHELASKDFTRWRPEIQNTVPVAGPTVPVAGQHGTCSGTVGSKIPPDGTCSGTVEAQKSISRYLRRDTYNIPGTLSPLTPPLSAPHLVAALKRRGAR